MNITSKYMIDPAKIYTLSSDHSNLNQNPRKVNDALKKAYGILPL